MTNNVLEEIEKRLNSFSKGQRSIANYILNHYEKAAYMTASKLGASANVSESTVVRFAFELGYDGYPELQSDIQDIIKNKLTSVQRIDVATDQIGNTDILNKVLNIDIDKIRKTLEETSKVDFDGAVESIVNAKKIYILGARSASILARFMALYFNIIFDHVQLVDFNSASEMFEQIMRVGKGDIMIGISFPRYSKRSIKALEFAKDSGATVIAISDSETSPLAQLSDYFLKARSDMTSFVDSLVAPMSLINALIVAVGLKKKDELKESFENLEQIWNEYDIYQQAEDE